MADGLAGRAGWVRAEVWAGIQTEGCTAGGWVEAWTEVWVDCGPGGWMAGGAGGGETEEEMLLGFSNGAVVWCVCDWACGGQGVMAVTGGGF